MALHSGSDLRASGREIGFNPLPELVLRPAVVRSLLRGVTLLLRSVRARRGKRWERFLKTKNKSK